MKRTGVLAVVLLAGVAACGAETVTLKPDKCVIVIPDGTNAAALKPAAFAAEELAKHFKLITGADVEIAVATNAAAGKYRFNVGIPFPGDSKPFASEEARRVVGKDAAYFYGEDANSPLFAVYGFLEDSLGVRWIEPGDVGIAFAAQDSLKLETGAATWIPKLAFRQIRAGIRAAEPGSNKLSPGSRLYDFQDFVQSVEENNAFAQDVRAWQKRMKMGGARLGGGHSFTDWWEKYGAAHPEYFALTREGKRAPVPRMRKGEDTGPELIKMCPSSTGLADRIIADWLPNKDKQQYVNVCENDGTENFCECPACRALDVTREGEKWDENLADRYVCLVNAVARKARQHRPDAWATTYAYMNMLNPPRKQKLEPNVVVQIVPYVNTLDMESVTALFKGWQEAGAKKLTLRPNYHFKYGYYIMPIGHEKQMFDAFQVAVKCGAVSADYDSLMNNWPVTGMSDYVLAKAIADPDKNFEYWEDHYCKAYGPAAEPVKQYFRYWREELWEKRLLPDIREIAKTGGAGDFIRGLMWNLGKYYKVEDFDRTDAILKQAAAGPLSDREKDRLSQLVLANRHARLVYNAVVPKGLAKCEPANALLAFRKEHKNDLRLRWISVFANEETVGDIAGIKLAKTMSSYQPPWLETDEVWRFKLDRDNAGLDQQWQAKPWSEIAGWEQIRTDKFWENQADEDKLMSAETRAMLEKYDGIAWYATQLRVPAELKGRPVFLRFGAVDESCWVFVNGKKAGEHIFTKGDDWKTPFEIQIDPQVDWNKPEQTVVVRVEDKSGVGGVWRPVWIVSKKK